MDITSKEWQQCFDDELAIYEARNRIEDSFVASDRFVEVITLLESQSNSTIHRLPDGVLLDEFNHVVNHIVSFTEGVEDVDALFLTYDYEFGNLTVSLVYPHTGNITSEAKVRIYSSKNFD